MKAQWLTENIYIKNILQHKFNIGLIKMLAEFGEHY